MFAMEVMHCVVSLFDDRRQLRMTMSISLYLSYAFQHTQEEWRNVFYVCAGFDAFGILIFGLFASGELQEWAKDVPITKDILVTAKAPEPATGIKRTHIDDAHSVSASGLKDSMSSACTKVLSSTGQTGLLKTVNEKLFESTYM